MRYVIHIALGECFKKVFSQIALHVKISGNENISDYIQYYVFSENENSDIVLSQVTVGKNDEKDFSFVHLAVPFKGEVNDINFFPRNTAKDQICDFFIERYTRTITINHRGDNDELLYMLYVPLYVKGACDKLKFLVDCIEHSDKPARVDVIGIAYDCAYVITSDEESKKGLLCNDEYKKIQSENLTEIMNYRKKKDKLLTHFFFFQNSLSSGVSIDLNLDSFVRILGEFILLLIAKYHEIFVGIDNSSDKIQVFGLSVINFDRYYFYEYMLYRVFKDAIKHEHVDHKSVDINKVSNKAQEVLSKNVSVFDDLYVKEVLPRYKSGISQNIIAEQLDPAIDKKVEDIKNDCISYISSEDFDMPEKKAILSCLLGQDDELLSGNNFNDDRLVFDDLYTGSIDFIVRSNNKLLEYVEHSVSAEQGKKDEKPEKALAKYAALSPNGVVIINPNGRLRQVRSDILKRTRYIRTLQGENSRLQSNIEITSQSKKIFMEGKVVINDNKYELLPRHEEINLDETFDASGIKPVEAVDMRNHMSPVKDQGMNGSCLAYTLVAIYEYLYGGAGQIPNKQKFSEAYLSFNMQHLSEDAKDDAEINFATALKALVQEGLCEESLCPYNENSISDKPSSMAYSDGVTRKLVVAKNVNLEVNDIKSALSEGYPVACSFNLYNSFSTSFKHGLVQTPSQEETEAENADENQGVHIMLLCGYDDKKKFFICRNSWGTKYGENGYCYLPYTYVLDRHLINFACIITKVETPDVKFVSPEKSVQVDMKGVDIQIFVNNNLIGYTRHFLLKSIQEKNVLQEEYVTLKQRLKDDSILNDIVNGTEILMDKKIEKFNIETQNIINSFTSILNEFNTNMLKLKVGLSSYIGVLLLILSYVFVRHGIAGFSILQNYDNIDMTAAIILLVGIVYIEYRNFICRTKKKEYKEQLATRNLELYKLT